MSKRFDNKKLLVIFGILIVILLLTMILKIPKEKSTLKGSIVELDTADVSRIMCIPKKNTGDPFEFVKKNNGWTIRQGNIISAPAKGAIQNIFTEILSIRPQSLAAKDKAKWTEYDLTDSSAIQIRLMNVKNKVLADLLIGKFTYKQVANPYNYNGGNSVEGTSYVRLKGENEVYAVEGFLAFSFGGGFNDWRDKSLIRCKKDDILKVTFTLPGDSSFTLMKKDKVWFVEERPADSAAVAEYLNSLAFIDGQDFKDGYRPDVNPDYQLLVEGNNLLNLSVKCYNAKETNDYLINSSLNPDIYFSSKRNGVFNQIFKPEINFTRK